MTAFTNDSIDLLEALAMESGNVFNMNRRGYLLATRDRSINLDELAAGYSDARLIRVHESGTAAYRPPASRDWETAPDGVDVLAHPALIRHCFPGLSPAFNKLVHIRRAGDISGQQLGQFMLEKIRDAGGRRITASIENIEANDGFTLTLRERGETRRLKADVLVNAAGPFVADVASMLGIVLPVRNVYQQKIAFEDMKNAVARDQPFTIDLDSVRFEWTAEEREFLEADDSTAWLCDDIEGGVHCRPDGGDQGSWIKLGWAFNRQPGPPLDDLAADPARHPQFPEIVLRGAARMLPALGAYLDDFPRRFSHYGGYYTMTRENWPLIGPLGVEGAFVVGALSGFGSMAAPAAGRLCADWITGERLPDYATDLSLARMDNEPFRAGLLAARSKGLL